MSTRDIAIVVPVLGGAPVVQALFDRIRTWSDQPREIIVVTAQADPDLSAICAASDFRYLESRPCRGGQMDGGARIARAEVLWFLHADAAPFPCSLNAIARALARGAEGGYFRFTFSGIPTWRKAVLAWLINLRVRLGGIPYGDQGIFVRRDAYLECGGFAHQPLFEEVALVRKLRARGRFRPLATRIGVSPRRWNRDGWIRRSLANRRLALAYLCGKDADRLADRYDEPNRSSGDPPGGTTHS